MLLITLVTEAVDIEPGETKNKLLMVAEATSALLVDEVMVVLLAEMMSTLLVDSMMS